MSDPLDELRGLAPLVDGQPKLLEHVRNNFMTLIEHDTHPTDGPPDELQPRRNRRRWAIPIATALVATTAAATFALTRSSSDSTNLQCPTGRDDDIKIVAAVTGNPVVDCSNVWRREHNSEPPAMKAYDNGSGGVTVRLANDPVPKGDTALDSGPYQNAALIELESSLDDVGSGLHSGCYDVPAARTIAQRKLDQLGLREWTISIDRKRRPDGASRCAYFITKPEEKEVQLIGMGSAADGQNPWAPFVADLNEQLTAECAGIDEAVDLTRTLAKNTDLEINGIVMDTAAVQVSTVDDPSASCTLADVNIGGSVEVMLRGPKR